MEEAAAVEEAAVVVASSRRGGEGGGPDHWCSRNKKKGTSPVEERDGADQGEDGFQGIDVEEEVQAVVVEVIAVVIFYYCCDYYCDYYQRCLWSVSKGTISLGTSEPRD